MANNNSALVRDLTILDDEKNPERSKSSIIYPKSTIDQIFDPNDNNKSLRQILAQLDEAIKDAGVGEIPFPVTSVNGEQGDVVLTKADIGLKRVDNTRDDEKPLSVPQREAIMEILGNINFEESAQAVINHLQDIHNPHGVNISQINVRGDLTRFVNELIAYHNLDDGAHQVLVDKINTLRDFINSEGEILTTTALQSSVMVSEHTSDPDAHGEIFMSKEDVSNKTDSIGDGDTVHYPSTRAVNEYVTDKITEFNDSLQIPGEWIADIRVLNNRSEVPSPSAQYERVLFIVKNGQNGYQEILICRKVDDDYYWDTSELGSPSKFNSDHFRHEHGETSLNISALGEILLNDRNIAQRVDELVSEKLPEATTEFATKSYVGHVIHKITILPGTIDGHIRFYENDDPSTMSDDIKVAGLQRLAYLENVSNNEILPESIDETQIKAKAIKNHHLDDKILTVRNFRVPYNTLIGNVSDNTGDSAQNVTLQQLASALAPFFEVHGDSIRAANIDY